VAGLVAANLFFLLRPAPRPVAVELRSDEGTRVLALGKRRTIEVRGPLGVTLVELDEAGARVISSPCPNRLCIRSGRVSRPGRVIACVPNRVALRLLDENETPASRGAVDAITR
jgi:hypothetical protein